MGTPVRATVGTETTIAAELVGLVFPSAAVAVTFTTQVPWDAGVNVKLGDAPVANVSGLPFSLTDQVYVNPAAISAGMGSVTVLPRVMGTPTPETAGAPTRATVGTETTIAAELVGLVFPSAAVAVTFTTQVPWDAGVNVKLGDAPVADVSGLPFSLTDQVYVNPAAISAGLGSVTVLPRVMGTPTPETAGAPTRATEGGTFETVTTMELCAVRP